jgi:type I restriction enzyme, R subunit
VRRILGSRYWTELQRRWPERIGQQAVRDPLVDRHAVDAGPFREDGGVRRLNRIFESRPEGMIDEIHGGDRRDTG